MCSRLPAWPRHAVSLIRKRVGACLFKLVKKGVVREVPMAGSYKGWEMAVCLAFATFFALA